MAKKKVWDNPIDKTIDWGGDINTENLPVSGAMIQQFIKESLEGKAGTFYYDTANNRYLVFSDTTNRDLYLKDPINNTNLIIGTFDAPFNYTAELNLITPSYNAIFSGSTGNYIEFTFDIKNKQGNSTGENAIVTYTFIRNAVKQEVKENVKYGEVVRINIDKYLDDGLNTVIIGITGQTTLAATTSSITYQVVKLTLTDEFDITKVYDLTDGDKNMEIPYTISGQGTKVMEWYIDGEQLPFIKNEDEFISSSASPIKTIKISNLTQGVHNIQFRAYVEINNERFYTNTMYREFFVYTNTSESTMISVALNIPNIYGIVGYNQSPIIYDIIQYLPYTIRFSTYSPINANIINTTVSLDNEQIALVGSKNGVENKLSIISASSGNKKLNITADSVERSLDVKVQNTSMDLYEITDDLLMAFSAVGRSNNDIFKNIWSYGDYKGTFTGFNWNRTSGWVDDRLEINNGASFAISMAPLSNDPTYKGRTIELEFSTKNVSDDNEVICDLRDSNGVGILITATKASLISSNGVVIDTEFKSEENIRLAFVINPKRESSSSISFIYVNGIVSRAASWIKTDNYNSETTLELKSSNLVGISLKYLRVYDRALNANELLNNFTLYRPTVSEMIEVYDRNNVYEDGTETFSPDKMMSRLPVMIVTGDIPILENSKETNTTIKVDIDYYNLQDPSKSFNWVNVDMKPQGTSSMGYPKKNFRIYSKELYSFKDGAQPVDCWCLKADYAESSGSHNTSIARLWNDALKNVIIGDSYVCRTEAQKAAIASNYEYDVRTAIDGFPILLFYRLDKNSDLVFIGKYNFNNDKSTESVFGFCNIPGFDDTLVPGKPEIIPAGEKNEGKPYTYGNKMQCWEIKTNGNPLALFQTVEDFDTGWSEAFESRYPDTKTPDVRDLKNFCTWISSVPEEDFSTQKWEHLNIYMVAAYWCYLMRHAAADQFVKNAMLTSEDGTHFYFILYDNDTINGLINSGQLVVPPTANRDTKGVDGTYLFAGRDSRLWNLLESDEEFMNIVAEVDQALYSAGISYKNAINNFDTIQSDKWVERVYNQDAQYKYIGPFNESGVQNLFMLQGKRDLHRKWWLAKRYSIIDAEYISGAYKSNAIDLKLANAPKGVTFSITSGYPLTYGYGINNTPEVSQRAFLEVGERKEFVTDNVWNIGDVVRIYASQYIEELDFSEMFEYISQIEIRHVYNEYLGTKLKRLIIGKEEKANNSINAISGLPQAKRLEYLNIRGLKALTSLDLSSNLYLKTLLAKESGLNSVIFAPGSPIQELELPGTLKTLELIELPNLSWRNIKIEEMNNLQDIYISQCPSVSNSFSFLLNWLENKKIPDSLCSLNIKDINWYNVTPEDFYVLCEAKKNGMNISLSGFCKLTTSSQDIVENISRVFGTEVFNRGNDFFISAPDGIYLTGPSEVIEGDSVQYETAVFSDNFGEVTWRLDSGVGCYLSDRGLLTTEETGNTRTAVIRAIHRSTTGVATNVTKSIQIQKRVYPSNITINGSASVTDNEEVYTWSSPTENITGNYTVEWSLGEEATEYLKIVDSNNESCTIVRTSNTPTGILDTSISLKVIKNIDNSIVSTASKAIQVFIEGVIMTSITNPYVQALLYTLGFVGNESYTLQSEVENLTAEDIAELFNYSTTQITPPTTEWSFPEFKYFIGVTNIPDYFLKNHERLKSIILPDSVTSVGKESFYRTGTNTNEGLEIINASNVETIGEGAFSYAKVKNLDSFSNLKTIGKNSFLYCTSITLTIPDSVTTIEANAFQNCPNLTSIVFPKNTSIIPQRACSNCQNLKTVILPEGIKKIDYQAFCWCNTLTDINIPNSITTLEKDCFKYCPSIKEFNIPESCTDLYSSSLPSSAKLTGVNVLSDEVSVVIGDTLKAVQHTSITEYHCDDSIKTLGPYVFEDSTIEYFTWTPNLSEGESVAISNLAFYNCDFLTSVEINGPISYIGLNAFDSCALLSDFYSGPIKNIGGYAFRDCPKLQSFSFEGTELIEQRAFYNSGLTSITFNSGTELQIDQHAFAYCKELLSIDFPLNTTVYFTLKDHFNFCEKLTSVNIPSSVKGICYFESCTGLINISFNNENGVYCRNCTSLEAITIGSNCSSMGYIYGCLKLKSITSLAMEAPSTLSIGFGYDESNYIGRETYNTGENILTVPVGSTGYDTSYWLDPLQNSEKCGFTISETL